jgi:hypothetical protein
MKNNIGTSGSGKKKGKEYWRKRWACWSNPKAAAATSPNLSTPRRPRLIRRASDTPKAAHASCNNSSSEGGVARPPPSHQTH